ncbi:membrane protein [Photobacterium aquae]|uniref:Membrane protein n=1 Tax=Photobacterium aquae TaxID=1195763 RepID=A0A0J1JP84_9GAMM|nr:hypothetical protein [Photobacterium aquae]KLV04022.1 membrane protein [Photobacterium aquae]
MNNKTFFTLHGVIYSVFAVALFALPAQMWPMYGVQINDQYALFLSQHTSIFLGGIAAISLLLRDIESGRVATKLLVALVITNGLGVLITGYAAVMGIFTGLGWSDPLFFLLLVILGLWQVRKQ